MKVWRGVQLSKYSMKSYIHSRGGLAVACLFDNNAGLPQLKGFYLYCRGLGSSLFIRSFNNP